MALGSNNRHFRPNRTPRLADNDESIVDLYVADERNQFYFTTTAFVDMFTGFYSFTPCTREMDKRMPVFIAGGVTILPGDWGTR